MSTVVNQPYSTAGSGGRKLTVLSNGWLVAVVQNLNVSPTDRREVRVYVSKDGGNSWEFRRSWGYSTASSSYTMATSIVARGDKVFLLYTATGTLFLQGYNPSTGVSDPTLTVDSSLTAASIQSASLAVNAAGTEIHIAWDCRNSTRPNSHNIRYLKGSIEGDGSVTLGPVEEVTKVNNSGTAGYRNPSIAVDGSRAVILADYATTGSSVIYSLYKTTTWQEKSIYAGGVHVQSHPSAVTDMDGAIHVAWQGTDTSNSSKRVRYSKSLDGGVTWTPMTLIFASSGALENPSLSVDREGKVLVLSTNLSGVIYRHTKRAADTEFTTNTLSGTSGSSQPSVLFDPTFAGTFGATPSAIYQAPSSVDYFGTYVTNQAPTLTLNTPNNATLYENDTYLIDGSARDTDIGNVVIVRYQINNGTTVAFETKVSDGTSIPFSRQLTFKGGKLHYNDVAITGALAEGTAHKLKVWAVDDQGGESEVIERTFYVVPNRAPSLTIYPFETLTDLIDADRVAMSGDSHDLDGNDVIVRYRINNGINTEIHKGPAGPWSFDFPLSKLKDGENTIVVEVVDTYDFKSSRTVKLNKHAELTPLTTSTQRYKITPPSGSAKGVLMWIQRDDTLTVAADISMSNGTEPESYAPMTLENTAPVAGVTVEDEFIFHKDESAEHINVKLTLSGEGAVSIISGVLSQ